jgi:small subunit ribosomal protein S8
MLTDPIADMLARVRNAAMARHEATQIPASGIKKAILQLLKDEGYVADVREEEWGPQKQRTLFVTLKYGSGFDCAIKGLRRVSKPGRRVYVSHKEIPSVLSGLGVSILSTSQGIMTDRLAREKRVGGELLCEVW